MNIEGIPAEIIEFVTSCIRSIEELDVLALLAEAPGRAWSIEDVDQIIRSTPKSVQSRLENLVSCGVIKASGEGPALRYSFEPESPEKAELAAKLLKVYKTHRVDVIELIYSSPSRTLASFSHAFKIRGKKEGEGQ